MWIQYLGNFCCRHGDTSFIWCILKQLQTLTDCVYDVKYLLDNVYILQGSNSYEMCIKISKCAIGTFAANSNRLTLTTIPFDNDSLVL